MQVTDNDAQVNVVFKLHPSLDEAASTREKRAIYKEIELCEISFAANKQTVGGFPAHEVFGWSVDDVTGVRVPQTYAMKYNEQYLKFKNGEGQAANGTGLEKLPFLSPAKCLELKALKIFTAEALAGLDGNNLKMLGMGGRDLKNKAAAFLEDQAGGADVLRMSEALSERDTQIAEMQAQIAALMQAQGLKQDVAATKQTSATAGSDLFEGFEDEDIRNWLKEADPALEIDGRWGRKTLIEKADAILAVTGKKNQAA